MSSKLTFQQIHTIWSNAVKYIRGVSELNDIKEQILVLVFIKRLSDTFEEAQEKIIKSYLDDGYIKDVAVTLSENRDEFDWMFFIPSSARWSELEKLNSSSEIGHKINRICYEIESNNPVLKGVLTSVDFVAKSAREKIWLDVICYFSQFSFCDDNFENSDLFFYAFESLLQLFANEAGRKGGEFYTPQSIAKLMIELLRPKEGMHIYDPTCGTGGLLVRAVNYLREQGSKFDSLTLFGQEINLDTWTICQMNMFIHKVFHSDIKLGDTLVEPKHVNNRCLQQFDCVLANPPYSMRMNEQESLYHDEYNRFRYGLPPKNYSDLAFLQHIIAALNTNGMAAVILPHGVLFRGNSEKVIREGILKDDLIEAVIGLPPGLFYGTSIPTCLIIINKNKSLIRQRKVLFIDASQDFLSTSLMNVLREQDIQTVVDAYDKFESMGTFSKIVSVDDILSKEANLNISLYVNNSPVVQEIEALLSHHEGFEQVSMKSKKLVKSIGVVKSDIDDNELNAIFLRRTRPELGSILLSLKGQKIPSVGYVKILFNKDKLLSEYAKLFFESQLGRKMLSQIPTGTSIQTLQAKSIQSLSIPIPTIDVQLEVIKVALKLEIARGQIDQFFKKLTTEPKKYKSIEDSTDEMVYRLSALSDVKHLEHLISLGETRQMEFKQSFFANVDKIRNEKVKVEKDRDTQGDIIKDIVSFLNTAGGILLIGVNDKGKVTGVDIEAKRFGFKKMDNYFQELGAQLASRVRADYAEYCLLTEVPFEGKTIVRIDCQPSPTPVFLDNTKFHVRTDTSSPELTGIEMLRYIQNHFKVALINDPENHTPTA
ncbi:N-6 DNA methylase [Vibrio salinus]|uniref:N-6 DNA methylase n=1 Tax=Vibrio salinus TaxID=2899784 RepID=UPI001E52CAEC|nr:N-6 DNA methylase [Vibrio salinus]MCE0493123.1 N-6 DNA methylase [Vibrio salinus]